MAKIYYFIVILSVAIRIAFYSFADFTSMKQFPMFSNPQTNFDELLEGYNMKLI